ncbi:MAG: hypothetical protein R3C19_01280 [Planctomycetaceae bacterium]
MSLLRKWRRRLLAVVLGLSVFPAFEVVCRIAGWGDSAVVADPFVGFAGIRPLFARNNADGRYHIAANRRGFFAEDSFLVKKPSNGFRIFVLGGSTVQGRPYSVETAFTSFLEMALNAAAPKRSWEVVNCGGISYASYRLVPIMDECLNYQPDLFIVCSGHNEFLEDITYRDVKNTAAELTTAYRWLTHLNSFRLLSAARARVSSTEAGDSSADVIDDARPVAVLPQEVDALLDHRGGLEAYNRNTLQRDSVVREFGNNLNRMVQTCKDAGVPVLLLMPPSNLRDCPPFKSEFSDTVDDTDRQAIVAELREATEFIAADEAETAISLLDDVTARDPQFAFSWYRLGHALIAADRNEEARAAFVRARDEDVCPLRMISPLESEMRQVAADTGTPLIEIATLLEGRMNAGIPGDAVLVDHIHPSFRGHQDIAMAIADWMTESGFVDDVLSDWKISAERKFQERLQTLDDLYFLRGQRTLEALRGWTQGRAEGPPLPKTQSP